MWLLHQMEPEAPTYNVTISVRLKGPLNVDLLGRSLNAIFALHESLRTTFVSDGAGALSQVIHPHADVSLSVVDVSAKAPSERELAAQQLVREQVSKAFPNLAEGPLWRHVIVRLDAQDHLLAVTFHHTLIDYWSQLIFLKSLIGNYDALVAGRPLPVSAPAVQYADYSVWQRRGAKDFSKEMAYWRDNLAGAPPGLELPTDKPRPSFPSSKGGRARLALPAELAAGVKRLAAEMEVTPFVVMHAALNILLARWTGQRDFVIGTVVADRSRKELEELIGCFLNFLPLRATLSDELTGSNVLKQAQQTSLEALARMSCPFEKIIEAARPARHAGQKPLYNVGLLLFNFPWNHFVGARTSPLQVAAEPVPTETAQLDLRFLVAPKNAYQEVVFSCEYNADLFEPKTIDGLLEAYSDILRQLIEQPGRALADFKLTGALAAQAQPAPKPKSRAPLAVAATFNAESIKEVLDLWVGELQLPFETEIASYNQVLQQLLDPASTFSLNESGVNVMLLRVEDFLRLEKGATTTGSAYEPLSSATEPRVARQIDELVAALAAAAGRSKTPHLVCLCPASPALRADAERAAVLARLEERLLAGVGGIAGVQRLAPTDVQTAYPTADYYDAYADDVSHAPYARAFLASIGTALARRIHALRQRQYKVIVLDCDNTLWGGVVGEDGAEKVSIAGPYAALQKFMLAQQQSGMLLAVCSKNNPEDVAEVFDKRSEMALSKEHIVSWRVNWERKSENIRAIAAELQLGLDSFIFVDDNPAECAEVRAACPEVLALTLPPAGEIESFLRNMWAFDHARVTEEDKKRTTLYRQNAQREQYREQAVTFSDYLAGLQLAISISRLEEKHIPRVAELTQRTNQFNFTGARRTETDVAELLRSGALDCLVVGVADRFGDYGIVGAMIFGAADGALRVDTVVLSCRALGRGVEHRMMAKLAESAKQRKLAWIDVPFKPTAKNKPALAFLNDVAGARSRQAGESLLFHVPTEDFVDLTYAPKAAEPAPKAVTEGSSKQSSGEDITAVIDRLTRIARTLGSPEAVLTKLDQSFAGDLADRPELSVEFAEPNTEHERKIAQIWQKALRIGRIGVDDNFFDLGGNSLLLAQIHRSLQAAFDVKFPLIEMLRHPTIAGLAGHIAQRQGRA